MAAAALDCAAGGGRNPNVGRTDRPRASSSTARSSSACVRPLSGSLFSYVDLEARVRSDH